MPMLPIGLQLEIFPAIEGSRIRVDLKRKHKPWLVGINWTPSKSGIWRRHQTVQLGQLIWRLREADNWAEAYRTACNAIEALESPSTRAALLRAVLPTPLAQIEVLEVWSDTLPDSTSERKRIEYRWRFVGSKPSKWDVEVDERRKTSFKGIAPYIKNFND